MPSAAASGISCKCSPAVKAPRRMRSRKSLAALCVRELMPSGCSSQCSGYHVYIHPVNVANWCLHWVIHLGHVSIGAIQDEREWEGVDRSAMRFGIFLAPFHETGENPTLAL